MPAGRVTISFIAIALLYDLTASAGGGINARLSFVAQSDQRVHSGGATRGQEAGAQPYQDHNRDHRGERPRIGCGNAGNFAGEEARERAIGEHTDQNAGRDQAETIQQHGDDGPPKHLSDLRSFLERVNQVELQSLQIILRRLGAAEIERPAKQTGK